MRVVDGVQRLSTVREFVRGEDGETFALSDLEYLADKHHGKRFGDLDPPLRRRLHNTQIVAHVIAPTTPPEVMYNIFKRINTGGTPLRAQEIRHCMSKNRSRDFLRRCAASDELHTATGGSLKANLRMADREMVLRFCAFRLRDLDAYKTTASMDTFLLHTTQQIDDPARVDDDLLSTLEHDFRRAMRNASVVFGEHAFRKWQRDQEYRNPINRALFESWSVALADHPEEDIATRAGAIRRRALALMTYDNRYLDAITTSTGDPARVEYRLTKAREAARAS